MRAFDVINNIVQFRSDPISNAKESSSNQPRTECNCICSAVAVDVAMMELEQIALDSGGISWKWSGIHL